MLLSRAHDTTLISKSKMIEEFIYEVPIGGVVYEKAQEGLGHSVPPYGYILPVVL